MFLAYVYTQTHLTRSHLVQSISDTTQSSWWSRSRQRTHCRLFQSAKYSSRCCPFNRRSTCRTRFAVELVGVSSSGTSVPRVVAKGRNNAAQQRLSSFATLESAPGVNSPNNSKDDTTCTCINTSGCRYSVLLPFANTLIHTIYDHGGERTGTTNIAGRAV